jgi:hypothetical protein
MPVFSIQKIAQVFQPELDSTSLSDRTNLCKQKFKKKIRSVISSSNIHCLHALVDIYGDNELSSLSAGSHDSMQVDIGSGGPAEGLSGLGASGFEPSCVAIEKVPLAVAQVGKVNLVLEVAASDS